MLGERTRWPNGVTDSMDVNSGELRETVRGRDARRAPVHGSQGHGDGAERLSNRCAGRRPADAAAAPLPAPRPTRGSRLCGRVPCLPPGAAACPLGSSGAGSVPEASREPGSEGLRSGCSALCLHRLLSGASASSHAPASRCLGLRQGERPCWPLGKLKLWSFLSGSLGVLPCTALQAPPHGALDGQFPFTLPPAHPDARGTPAPAVRSGPPAAAAAASPVSTPLHNGRRVPTS